MIEAIAGNRTCKALKTLSHFSFQYSVWASKMSVKCLLKKPVKVRKIQSDSNQMALDNYKDCSVMVIYYDQRGILKSSFLFQVMIRSLQDLIEPNTGWSLFVFTFRVLILWRDDFLTFFLPSGLYKWLQSQFFAT